MLSQRYAMPLRTNPNDIPGGLNMPGIDFPTQLTLDALGALRVGCDFLGIAHAHAEELFAYLELAGAAGVKEIRDRMSAQGLMEPEPPAWPASVGGPLPEEAEVELLALAPGERMGWLLEYVLSNPEVCVCVCVCVCACVAYACVH